jgi:chromate transport protein ChrA
VRPLNLVHIGQVKVIVLVQVAGAKAAEAKASVHHEVAKEETIVVLADAIAGLVKRASAKAHHAVMALVMAATVMAATVVVHAMIVIAAVEHAAVEHAVEEQVNLDGLKSPLAKWKKCDKLPSRKWIVARNQQRRLRKLCRKVVNRYALSRT